MVFESAACHDVLSILTFLTHMRGVLLQAGRWACPVALYSSLAVVRWMRRKQNCTTYDLGCLHCVHVVGPCAPLHAACIARLAFDFHAGMRVRCLCPQAPIVVFAACPLYCTLVRVLCTLNCMGSAMPHCMLVVPLAYKWQASQLCFCLSFSTG